MSELSTKAMQFAERMQNGPYVHLKDTRDLLTACAEQLDDNETHQESLLHMIDQKDALIAELVGALENAQRFIKNGIEFGYIKMPDGDDPAWVTSYVLDAALAKAKEAGHVRKD